ncbi:hypothetical protein H5154_20525 [Pseudoalteromonas sp. SR44-5]|uniref:hypothetical protein n=1 Tax=Pseudoalteromonas sp. SR44-5 TaxID=2760934 RepID=UPI001601121B|nr:hypothetical protein [Pseudoalteromonas sp. SR44-5]MBB1368727.1 hypothetical protein [Pseudoalteromonas sp. SR44-5]
MDVFSPFATIVGLICNYKSENRAASDDEYREFVEWLDKKRHKDIIDELNSNHLLGLSLKNLLNQSNDLVVNKLSDLDKSLIDIASRIDGFKDIATAVSKHEGLSDQAISILKQFDKSGGRVFLEINCNAGTDYQIMDGSRGKIVMDEPRFINDDLDKLCELGLLTPDYNESGGRLFRITRIATSLVKQVANEL